jgi:hypothetical protein
VIAVGAVAWSSWRFARYDLGAAHWSDDATTLSTRVLRDISLLGGTLAMILSRRASQSSSTARTIAAIFTVPHRCRGGPDVLVESDEVHRRPITPGYRSSPDSRVVRSVGHADGGATFAAIASLKRPFPPYEVIAASFAVAIATAVTRHVSAGRALAHRRTRRVALGWGWLRSVRAAFGGRVLRFGQPVVVAEAAAKLTPIRSAQRRNYRSWRDRVRRGPAMAHVAFRVLAADTPRDPGSTS